MNIPTAIENFKIANSVLYKYGAFICFGTLLGYHRCGGFLEHDGDIDFGLFRQNWSPKIIDEMKAAGFVVKHIMGNLDTGFCITFFRQGISVDLTFFYKEGDKITNGAWVSPDGAWDELELHKYYMKDFWTYSLYNFYGVMVHTPHDIKSWLLQIYGNFNKENKEYKYWKDSPSIMNTYTRIKRIVVHEL